MSVSNISGHKGATVRRHYILHEREEDTRNSMDAFSALRHHAQISSSSSCNSSRSPTQGQNLSQPVSSSVMSTSRRNNFSSPVNSSQTQASPVKSSFDHRIRGDTNTLASTPSVSSIDNSRSGVIDLVNDEEDEERDDNEEEEEEGGWENTEQEEGSEEEEEAEEEEKHKNVNAGREMIDEGDKDDDSHDGTFYYAAKKSAEEWGTKHPDGRKVDARKAQWSKAEIDYIKDWCDHTLLEHPQWIHTIRSKCLNFILKDPKARPIFHPNHIINGRITHGYKVAYGLN